MGFSIRPLHVKDVLRIEADARENQPLHRRIMGMLTHRLTWAVDEGGETYLFAVDGQMREDSGKNHYLLCLRGNWAQFSTESIFSDRVELVQIYSGNNASRQELWTAFKEALAVYGRWGAGAGGKYCRGSEPLDGAFSPIQVGE